MFINQLNQRIRTCFLVSLSLIFLTLSLQSSVSIKDLFDHHWFRKQQQTEKFIFLSGPLQCEKLPLYTVLLQIQATLNSKLKDSLKRSNSSDQTLFMVVKLSQDALDLFKDTVKGFNNGCFSANPDILQRFYRMCNVLADIDTDELMPDHFRKQKEMVEQFNQHLSAYCLTYKDFLNQGDVKLYEKKIMKLNLILTLCLLRPECLSLSIIDKLQDAVMVQPKEWLARHKMIVTAGATVVGALGCWYLYKRVKSKVVAWSTPETKG